jgi:hypothetical protein
MVSMAVVLIVPDSATLLSTLSRFCHVAAPQLEDSFEIRHERRLLTEPPTANQRNVKMVSSSGRKTTTMKHGVQGKRRDDLDGMNRCTRGKGSGRRKERRHYLQINLYSHCYLSSTF